MKRFGCLAACILTVFALFAVGCEKKPVEITDISLSGDLDYADTPEQFWEDDEYTYIFSAIKSFDYTVFFSNGERMNLIDALKSGRAAIDDLDRFDIHYYKQAKKAVTNISFSEDAVYGEAEECFWADDEYRYIFSCIMSWDCTVYYQDGTSENLIDALKSGRATIEDLERFDIFCHKEKIE